MENVDELIDTPVSNHKIVIFSKTYCPFCKRAKALFDALNEEYLVIELNEMLEGEAIQAALLERTGQKTVPHVYVGERHLGGYNETKALEESGELAQLLAA